MSLYDADTIAAVAIRHGRFRFGGRLRHRLRPRVASGRSDNTCHCGGSWRVTFQRSKHYISIPERIDVSQQIGAQFVSHKLEPGSILASEVTNGSQSICVRLGGLPLIFAGLPFWVCPLALSVCALVNYTVLKQTRFVNARATMAANSFRLLPQAGTPP